LEYAEGDPSQSTDFFVRLLSIGSTRRISCKNSVL
jgi:hypothetical protein